MNRHLLFSFLAVLPLGPAVTAAPTIPLPRASGIVQDPAPSEQLAPTLLRIGLDAEAMATAGCTTAEVAAAASALNTHLLATPTDIPNADAAWSTAKQAVDAMKRKIKSGLADETEIASLAGLEATLASAAATRDILLGNASAIAFAGLSTAKANLLNTISANSDWSLPTYYLAVDRTQKDWVSLRNALDEKRIAAKYDEDVSAASLAVIASAMGDSTVAAAKVNLDTNLATIEAAWKAATE